MRHLTGTCACNHHGNLPNEPHFEQRAGLCSRRQFKLFAVRGRRRPPVDDSILYEFWTIVHRISPFTRRGHAKKNNKATQRVGWVELFAKPITFAGALGVADHVPCPLLSTGCTGIAASALRLASCYGRNIEHIKYSEESSAPGHKRTSGCVRARSAHTPISDIAMLRWHVRFVPLPDVIWGGVF